MREKKKLRGVDTERQRKRRRKKERAAEVKAAREEQKMDMFDFLNKKIFKKSESVHGISVYNFDKEQNLVNSSHDEVSSTQQSQAKTSGKSENLNVRVS